MSRKLTAVLLAVLLIGGAGYLILRDGSAPRAHAPGFGAPPQTLRLPPPATGAQTVEMFDTVTLGALAGLHPQVLAGYTAGAWPTYFGLVHAYPHVIVKSIAIQAGYHAMCLDVEPGDAVPAQAPGWWRADRAAGFQKPCIYTSLSMWPQVRYYLNAAGIPRSSYFAWDANWTYYPHLDAGFDATQWSDHAYGRNLDESTVTLAFAGLAPKPKPVLPVCIHHRLSRSQCAAVRRQVAGYRAAVSSSQGAYDARACGVLSQRAVWFSSQLRRHPHTKVAARRRALALSRRAYRERSCAVFAGRVRFYSAVIARTEAAS